MLRTLNNLMLSVSLRFLLGIITAVLLPSAVAADDSEGAVQTLSQFTKNKIHHPGFYDLYYDEAKGDVYLQIDNFKQPFIFQSSMPRGVGSNDIGLDRGLLGNTRLVQFERHGDKVLLKQINTEFRASANSIAERASVKEAFAQSVIASFEIVAENPGGVGANRDAVIIDYTHFLLSDVDRMSGEFSSAEQGSFEVDAKRSVVYQERTKAFPDNTELEALVTFKGSEPGNYVKQVSPDANSVSVHLHHSLVRLPEDNYRARAFHPYSGFWKFSYKDYSVPIEQPMEIRSIPRHRLNKKDPSAAKSEPVEPIVYYLDPGVPEPIRSALSDGALWWNQAFERIGYINAFQVKTLPANVDPMDVRYNVIQWVHRATRGWSYGSTVQDPRTGEIIKGHVTLGSLRVRQDYLLAVGLTSPFNGEDGSDNSDSQKKMALARIRQLAAHEVGHTIGIAHNFAASADNRASVMDYPHPLVSLRDDKVVLDDAYGVGLGEWDYHVVEYGYQDYGRDKPAAEAQALKELIQRTRQKGLSYQSDPDSRSRISANSTGHLWDGGKEPVEELIRLGKVRAHALNNFGLNSIPKGASLSSLEETLVPVYLLHRYQLDAVAKLVGGVSYEYELKGDYSKPKGLVDVQGDAQRKAMTALIDTITSAYLQVPESITALLPPKAYGETRSRESFNGRTGLTFDPLSTAESAAAYTLSLLLDANRLNRLSQQHNKSATALGVEELLNSVLEASIENDHGNIRAHALQNRINYLVIDRLMLAVNDKELAPEVRTELIARVSQLDKLLSKNKRDIHKAEMSRLLDLYWRTGQWQGGVKVKPLPPGSPI
ncbi:MAG: zinc-dependent metalloprotease [Pseudomonadales bacterium]